jgi:short-subunit dehydrogenase
VAAASVGVDVAVNVLGISRRKPVLEPKPEEFSKVLELNRRTVPLHQGYGELMVPTGKGKIINMASISESRVSYLLPECYLPVTGRRYKRDRLVRSRRP